MKVYIAAVIGVTLAGCQFMPPQKMYSGPELDPSQLAILEFNNQGYTPGMNGLHINAVDGQSTTIRSTVLHVAPGPRELEVTCYRPTGGPMTGHVYGVGHTTLNFDAGQRYRVEGRLIELPLREHYRSPTGDYLIEHRCEAVAFRRRT